MRIPVDEGLRLREKAFWSGDLFFFGNELDGLYTDDEYVEDAMGDLRIVEDPLLQQIEKEYCGESGENIYKKKLKNMDMREK